MAITSSTTPPLRLASLVLLLMPSLAHRSVDKPLTAWVSAPDPRGREVCALHFRIGECRSKRCKYSHAVCLSAPSPPPGGRQSLPSLSRVDLAAVDPGGELVYDKNLRTQRRAKSRLLYVEFEGALVYDFEVRGAGGSNTTAFARS